MMPDDIASLSRKLRTELVVLEAAIARSRADREHFANLRGAGPLSGTYAYYEGLAAGQNSAFRQGRLRLRDIVACFDRGINVVAFDGNETEDLTGEEGREPELDPEPDVEPSLTVSERLRVAAYLGSAISMLGQGHDYRASEDVLGAVHLLRPFLVEFLEASDPLLSES